VKILEGEVAEPLLLPAVLAGQKLLEEHVGLVKQIYGFNECNFSTF
jgi:hypothetical protein